MPAKVIKVKAERPGGFQPEVIHRVFTEKTHMFSNHHARVTLFHSMILNQTLLVDFQTITSELPNIRYSRFYRRTFLNNFEGSPTFTS